MRVAANSDYYVKKLAHDERVKQRVAWKREGRLLTAAEAAQLATEIADFCNKLRNSSDEKLCDGFLTSIDQRVTKLNAWSQARRI